MVRRTLEKTARGQRLIPVAGCWPACQVPLRLLRMSTKSRMTRPLYRTVPATATGGPTRYNRPSLPPDAMACLLVVTPSLR